MPQTKSAKKALRVSLRKRLTNLAVLKKLKTAVAKFKKNPNQTEFVKTQSIVDTAAKKKVISKNKAARIKSRLAKLVPKRQTTPKSSNRGLTKKRKAGNLSKSKI